MQKRGISAVVGTILTILIIIAAVTIIWTIIIPIISDSLKFEDARLYIVTEGGFTFYDKNEDILVVQIKRSPDDGNITKMRLIFLFEGNSKSIIVKAPDPNNMKVYYFNLSNMPKIPEFVKVVPIFDKGKTSEEGSVTSEKEIPQKPIINIPDNLLIIGCEDTETICDDGADNNCNGLIDEEDPECAPPVLTSDPNGIYYWSFNSDMTDSISSITGEPYGNTTLGPALFGNGLILDGDNDYLNCGNEPATLFDSSIFSVSFWFKKDASETSGIIISFADATGVNIDDTFNGAIRPGASGSVLNLTISEETFTSSIISSTEIDNNWHHVVFAYSINTESFIIYLDGNIDKIATTSVDIPFKGNIDLIFGCQKTSNKCNLDENAFKGTIDETIIFDDFLTPQEVIKLYNQEYLIDLSGFNWVD